MSLVLIKEVDSYRESAAIRSFVERALKLDPSTGAILRRADPGHLVVVKPNWVQEAHEYRSDVWEPVITHPSVVLATLECLAKAMGGRGTIALCDAPHTYASFDAILCRGGLGSALSEFRSRWPDLRLELIDLRREVWILEGGVIVERAPNPPDPRDYVALDLGRDSHFHGFRGEGRYYGADYDSEVVNAHHHGEVQEYLIAGTPIACDLFVNLPKLKTHKKTGITCCLKNLVGINGDKNWLPHHTEASPRDGGDEFPDEIWLNRLERHAKKWGREFALRTPWLGQRVYRAMRTAGLQVIGDSETVIRNGNWSGNDTCWRMVLDLNRALLFGTSKGEWRDAIAPKRYLAIVDGIVGGQGNGPLCPSPAASGVLLAGTNPASVDAVASRAMGFDPLALEVVAQAFSDHRWPIHDCAIEEVRVQDSRCDAETGIAGVRPVVEGGFEPHFGWTSLRPS